MNSESNLQLVTVQSQELPETPFVIGMQTLVEQPELITVEIMLALITLAVSPTREGIHRKTQGYAAGAVARLLGNGSIELERCYRFSLIPNSDTDPNTVLQIYLRYHQNHPLAQQLANQYASN